MITKDLLRAIRNDLPMKLTVCRLGRLGRHGPISKQSTAPHQGDAYFRFQCPHCRRTTGDREPEEQFGALLQLWREHQQYRLAAVMRSRLRSSGHDPEEVG